VKVLILKPSSLGDVIQALPVLRLIKLHRPDAEIWWWIDSGLAPLLAHDPDLTGIILFERRRWGRPRYWHELLGGIHGLRAHHFDWVIDLQSLARSGAFAWLACGKLTIGLDDAREGARGFYDIAVRRPSPTTHAVDWYLQVLPFLRIPIHHHFDWMPRHAPTEAGVLARAPRDGTKWVALQPGARWENKRWPLESYVAVARSLIQQRPDVRVAVVGGKDDQTLGAAICGGLGDRGLDLTGRTSLPEMMEWVRRCDVMVTNDTGPMHVAAAMGRPIVSLFGPTDPRRTGPYGQIDTVLQHALPCRPCLKAHCEYHEPMACLKALGPQLVVKKVLERL